MKKYMNAATAASLLILIILAAAPALHSATIIRAGDALPSNTIYVTHDLKHVIVASPQGSNISLLVYTINDPLSGAVGEVSMNYTVGLGGHALTHILVQASKNLGTLAILDRDERKLFILGLDNQSGSYKLKNKIANVEFFALKPSGDIVILYSNNSLWTMNVLLPTPRPQKISVTPADPLKNLKEAVAAFSSDGEEVAIVGLDKEGNQRIVVLTLKSYQNLPTTLGAEVSLNILPKIQDVSCQEQGALQNYQPSIYAGQRTYVVAYSCAGNIEQKTIIAIRPITTKSTYYVIKKNTAGAVKISPDGSMVYIAKEVEELPNQAIMLQGIKISAEELAELIDYAISSSKLFTEKYEQLKELGRQPTNEASTSLYEFLSSHVLTELRTEIINNTYIQTLPFPTTKTIVDSIVNEYNEQKNNIKKSIESLNNTLSELKGLTNELSSVCGLKAPADINDKIKEISALLSNASTCANMNNLTQANAYIKNATKNLVELETELKSYIKQNVDQLISCANSVKERSQRLSKEMKKYDEIISIIKNIKQSRYVKLGTGNDLYLNNTLGNLPDINALINNIKNISDSIDKVVDHFEKVKRGIVSSINLTQIGADLSIISEANNSINNLEKNGINKYRTAVPEVVGKYNISVGEVLLSWIKGIEKDVTEPVTGFFPGIGYGVDGELRKRLEGINRSLMKLIGLANLSSVPLSSITDLDKQTIDSISAIVSNLSNLEGDVLAARSSLAFQANLTSATAVAILATALIISGRIAYGRYRSWAEDKPRREMVKRAASKISELRKAIARARHVAGLPEYVINNVMSEIESIEERMAMEERRLRRVKSLAEAKAIYSNLLQYERELRMLENFKYRFKRICEHGKAVQARKLYTGTTDIGGRLRNEDYFATALIGGCVPVFAVADGVGGMKAGNIASKTAVDTLIRYLEAEFKRNPVNFVNKPEEVVRAAVSVANKAVTRLKEQYGKAATTLTAGLVIDDEKAVVAHVGDSRAYLLKLREKRIRRLTEDDTLVNQLIKEHKISPEEAKTHPQRHVLLKALGSEAGVEPQIIVVEGSNLVRDTAKRGAGEGPDLVIRRARPIRPSPLERLSAGDLILLCTDGLTDTLSDEEILTIALKITKGGTAISLETLNTIAKYLILNARRKGSNDNITVVIYSHLPQ